jgi:hypothetical protein
MTSASAASSETMACAGPNVCKRMGAGREAHGGLARAGGRRLRGGGLDLERLADRAPVARRVPQRRPAAAPTAVELGVLGVLRGKCLANSAFALRSREKIKKIKLMAFIRSNPGFVCVRQGGPCLSPSWAPRQPRRGHVPS